MLRVSFLIIDQNINAANYMKHSLKVSYLDNYCAPGIGLSAKNQWDFELTYLTLN